MASPSIDEISLSEWATAMATATENQTLPQTGDSPSSDDSALSLPLVDLRLKQDTADHGIITSVCGVPVVHLPWPSLQSGERSGELPPRHVAFQLLVSGRMWRDEKASMVAFFLATVSRATGQSRKPWLVRRAVVYQNDEDLDKYKAQWTGSTPDCTDNHGRKRKRFYPLPRLWQPDPLLPTVLWPQLELMLQERLGQDVHKRQTRPGQGRELHLRDEESRYNEVWDLGSGGGRDVCYLAEQIRYTLHCHQSKKTTVETATANPSFRIRVVGLDNHKASAKRCLPFWKHRGVEEWTEARLLDVTKMKMDWHSNAQPESPKQNDDGADTDTTGDKADTESTMLNLPSTSTATTDVEPLCVYAVRFWHRPTVEKLEQRLSPGSLFALSHFCRPHNGAPWDFDHPKPSKVLERNDLATIFERSGNWDILHDDIVLDGDHGRTLVQFVAKKKDV